MKLVEAIEEVKKYQQLMGNRFVDEPHTLGEMTPQRMVHIRDLAFATMVEVAEFADWLPWKPWREINEQKCFEHDAAEELVDIFFFNMNLWLTLGFTPEQFIEKFKEKLLENHDRIARGYNGKELMTATRQAE